MCLFFPFYVDSRPCCFPYYPVSAMDRCLSRYFPLLLLCLYVVPIIQAQGAKQSVPETPVRDPDIDHIDLDHIKERSEWFARGRVVRGQPSAEFRRRAYQAKLQ